MIKVSGLTKCFGKQSVLNDLSFVVADRDGIFVTGPSGCGKTTLLRILSGFDTDYSGEIIIDGSVMGDDNRPADRNIAIVFQEPALWNHMTVEKNMSYGMKEKDRERLVNTARALRIEELFGKYPEEISGGEAKRVSLARAILSGKGNLLLDEPLSNVDTDTKEIIIDYLKSDVLVDKCVIYVTHDINEIEKLPFDRIDLGR